MTACQYIGTEQGYSRLLPACSAPSLPAKSYCADHYHVVYQKGSAQGRRVKDQRHSHGLREIVSDFNDVYSELLNEGEIEET
jgi:hypothetical protein